jgi:hypothetical protein
MGNKDEFLNRLAIITNNLDELNLKHKKITLTIYLENDEYQHIYKIITSKRYDDIEDNFSIYIDDYEIIISKVI